MMPRRIMLALLAAVGLFVGIWATVLPGAFYAGFPGFGFGSWVGDDGAFNEHLIRDVGELNLALAAASIAAMFARTPATAAVAARIVAVAWLVYSVPHLAYHLAHLSGFSLVDAIAEPVALSLSIALSVPLLIGDRRARAARAAGQDAQPHPTTEEN